MHKLISQAGNQLTAQGNKMQIRSKDSHDNNQNVSQ